MARQPWGADGGPDAETLRALRAAGLSQRQIAEKYHVARQTVAYWMNKHNIEVGKPVYTGTHKDILPWELRGDDHHDSIARALRWYNSGRKGVQLEPQQQREVDRLIGYLDKESLVVDYDREQGFILRRRKAGVDKRGDYIRRPLAVVAR